MKRLVTTLTFVAGCGQQLVGLPEHDLGADQHVGDLASQDFAPKTDGGVGGDGFTSTDASAKADGAIDFSFPFDLAGDMVTPCRALALDGVEAVVTAPSQTADNPSGDVTVEAWVYQTARTADSVVAGHWGDTAAGTASYVLEINAAGHVVFHLSPAGTNDVSAATAAVVPLNAWTHVAGHYSPGLAGSQVAAFLNGGNEVSTTVGLSFAPHSVTGIPLHIGRFPAATTVGATTAELPFRGFMHDVRVSAATLYPTNTTPPTRLLPDSTTVALYHFDELSGSNAADSSVHANPSMLLKNAMFGTPPMCP